MLSARHALYVGWVCGTANRNGVPLDPVVDEAGDYTDRRLALRVRDLPPNTTITLVVPEPPADWTIPPRPEDLAGARS